MDLASLRVPETLTQKLIRSHLLDAQVPSPGEPIRVRVDQTLTQDATGTLVMLSLESLGLERSKVEIAAQYVDHNLVQADYKNADDHLFLHSACRRFGLWFSRPGGGVSHPVHQQRFGRPGALLLGSDSHTCAAGALGMLAIGTGGLDVALAIAGEPYGLRMPAVWGVRLTGELPDWVSAKDVILEMLRRHGVGAGRGRVIEYHGPGVASLSAMDRHVIANMGAELGATSTVFPSDDETRRYLAAQGREAEWEALSADEGALYDVEDAIDLGSLEPLIAKPKSPGNVVPVREVAGAEIYQAYIGSSANPGFRDFAIAALMVRGKRVPAHVSFDIAPTSRQLLDQLLEAGLLAPLIDAGARLHQAGCNGCIGMGQAPASGKNSLRTTPRNFPGRSGTPDDLVWLCSPETAAASALHGVITDPRELGDYPRVPAEPRVHPTEVEPPPPAATARTVKLVKGPNIKPIPDLAPLPSRLELTVALVVGDDISTDTILPAGARVLPYRSNVPRLAELCFADLDPSYPERAMRMKSGHAIVGGVNYGQGSSREHAALAPRHLGLRAVIAKSFARIHRSNLINYGVLPLVFEPDGIELEGGDVLVAEDLSTLAQRRLALEVRGKGRIETEADLSDEEVQVIRAGGRIAWLKGGRSARGDDVNTSARPRNG